MQCAKVYRGVVVAAPEQPQNRVTAAQAADELLNIAGAEASVVIYPTADGAVFASARSIGEMNVQLIMEKMGGGGNRSAAAARMEDIAFADAVQKLHETIDAYLDD
jgi:c-di-AMP phosphodiesterase-like protein